MWVSWSGTARSKPQPLEWRPFVGGTGAEHAFGWRGFKDQKTGCKKTKQPSTQSKIRFPVSHFCKPLPSSKPGRVWPGADFWAFDSMRPPAVPALAHQQHHHRQTPVFAVQVKSLKPTPPAASAPPSPPHSAAWFARRAETPAAFAPCPHPAGCRWRSHHQAANS